MLAVSLGVDVDGGERVLRGVMVSSRLDGGEDETSWDVEIPVATCCMRLPGDVGLEKWNDSANEVFREMLGEGERAI